MRIISLILTILLLNACIGEKPQVNRIGRGDRWSVQETMVYMNEELILAPKPELSRFEIDLDKQLVTLFQGDTKVMVARCSTGSRKGSTPKGEFKILEKAKEGKESNLYGSFYNAVGQKVYYGDRREFKGEGTFEGSEMKNWLRLTGDGVGMHHSGNIWKYPASAGCIRLSMPCSEFCYDHARVGTPVKIF